MLQLKQSGLSSEASDRQVRASFEPMFEDIKQRGEIAMRWTQYPRLAISIKNTGYHTVHTQFSARADGVTTTR